MAEEQWITVKIGGYPRRVPKSKLPEIYKNAEEFIEKYVKMGVPRETVEEVYSVEVAGE